MNVSCLLLLTLWLTVGQYEYRSQIGAWITSKRVSHQATIVWIPHNCALIVLKLATSVCMHLWNYTPKTWLIYDILNERYGFNLPSILSKRSATRNPVYTLGAENMGRKSKSWSIIHICDATNMMKWIHFSQWPFHYCKDAELSLILPRRLFNNCKSFANISACK